MSNEVLAFGCATVRLTSRWRDPGNSIKSQYETLAAFRYALRRFIHFSEEAAQAAGITAQQHQALLAIKGFPARDKRHRGRVGGTIAASSPQRGWVD